jgi:hypothetical protein
LAHNSENGYKIADKLKNHTRSVEQLAKVNSSIDVDNNRYNKNKKFGSMVSRNLVAHTNNYYHSGSSHDRLDLEFVKYGQICSDPER